MAEAGKVLLPRGRPKRGKSVDFYRELAKSYREFELGGLSPVKEIARRKRVSENTVHQWVHRMRHELGFLEPSPRSKRKEKSE
jgi:transposase